MLPLPAPVRQPAAKCRQRVFRSERAAAAVRDDARIRPHDERLKKFFLPRSVSAQYIVCHARLSYRAADAERRARLQSETMRDVENAQAASAMKIGHEDRP